MPESSTLFDRVGGRPFFEALTHRFYQAVAADDVLRRLYPDDPDELEAARLHLELFLAQFWGGPPDYNEARGAPRLRLRHARFSIGTAERDAWVEHMSEAVRAAGLQPLDELQLLSHLSNAATHLINQPA
ncbi:MAG: globin [Acidimicrobiales bacterium]|nr:globin [Acidimicrobiales bacterium]